MENYYAVKVGRKPGIYLNWDDCKKQVHGFPGAIYKKWKTREEAEKFLLTGGSFPIEKEIEADIPVLNKEMQISSILKCEGKSSEEEQAEQLFRKFNTDALAFVDGSFQKDTKIYGYGVVFMEREGELSKHKDFGADKTYAEMRNVSGEILGARRAVELAIEKNLSSLTIFHDYQGISSWAKGEWKCNKEKTKEYHDFMQNAEKKIRLEFFKVPAHRGIYFNEIADALAKEAVTAR